MNEPTKMKKLTSMGSFQDFIGSSPMAAVYFSGPDCNVCSAIKPKLLELFATRFPAVAVAEVDCGLHPPLAAQQTVFTVPTLIVYFDGREGLRKARTFSLEQVAAELERPYSICFEGHAVSARYE